MTCKTCFGKDAPAWIATCSFTSQRRAWPAVTQICQRRISHMMKRKATIMSNSDEAQSDDYVQFEKLLGGNDATNGKSKELEARGDASPENSREEHDSYEEFADLLGVEAEPRQETSVKKVVKEATTAKREIDPADYALFDSLLQGSGGSGRKPVKGSRRFITHPAQLKDFQARGKPATGSPRTKTEGISITSETNISDNAPLLNQERARFSDEEITDAYKIMEKEFGNRASDTAHEEEDSVDETLESEKPQLLRPPKRPQDSISNGGAEISPISATETSAALVAQSPEETKPVNIPIPPLIQKPTRPSDPTADSAQDVKYIDSEDSLVSTDGPLVQPQAPILNPQPQGSGIDDPRPDLHASHEVNPVLNDEVGNVSELLQKPDRAVRGKGIESESSGINVVTGRLGRIRSNRGDLSAPKARKQREGAHGKADMEFDALLLSNPKLLYDLS